MQRLEILDDTVPPALNIKCGETLVIHNLTPKVKHVGQSGDIMPGQTCVLSFDKDGKHSYDFGDPTVCADITVTGEADKAKADAAKAKKKEDHLRAVVVHNEAKAYADARAHADADSKAHADAKAK